MTLWESRTTPKSHGFTIVELLIVVIVIGILASISIVAYTGVQSRAKDSVVSSNIAQVTKALEIYYQRTNSYPKSAEWGEMGLNDSTGTWPIQNMEGVNARLLKFPYDTSNSVSSFQEQGGWLDAARAQNGKIGYFSVISAPLQDAGHWTCYSTNDICTAYRIYYRLSDGLLRTKSGGVISDLPTS